MEESRRRFLSALLLGIWIYGLVLWGYIVIDSFLFPPYQYLAISQYVPIRQNLLADIAFPSSFVAFVLWAYYRGQRGP